MASSTSFPSSGTVQIGSELITYTGNSGGTLSGLTRGATGTTAAIHSSGATVTDAANFFAWNAAASGDIVTDPGLWSLDNLGNSLVATIFNGESFTWDSDVGYQRHLQNFKHRSYFNLENRYATQ